MGTLYQYGKKAMNITLVLAFCLVLIPVGLVIAAADFIGLLGD